MTVGKVAALWGVSTETVRRACSRGEVDFFRTPRGHRRISPASAETVRAQMHKSAPSSS